MPSNTDALRAIEDPAKRADFVLSGLSSGGEIQPVAAKKFIQVALNATPLLRQCNQIEMPSKEYHIPLMAFNSAILRAETTELSEIAPGRRASPTMSETVLTAHEYDGEVQISYKAIEDNVEAAALENTIITKMAERIGVDIETLGLSSDTTIVDTDLVAGGFAQQDGWLKLITTNSVNASNAHINKSLFERARTSVELRFRQQFDGQYKFFVEQHAANKWRESISDRMTVGGDAAIFSGDLPRCGGTAVEQVGLMPVVSGTPDTSTAIFCHPKNLMVGMWTKMSLRAQDWPAKRCVRIFARVRLAFAVEQEYAASKIINVRATTA